MTDVTILTGDCRAMLRTLAAGSVQTCITSPPYFGLRSYGGEPQVWGGDQACEHVWGATLRAPWANQAPGLNGRKKNVAATRDRPKETGPFCSLCSAWFGHLGLEPTPELFIADLVDVFAVVRRVLRDDGTLWLNIGDSYAGSWGAYSCPKGDIAARRYGGTDEWTPRPATSRLTGDLKNKDLIGIPWMLAFALRADGWYLRSDIIWHKPNAMPESVRDRPTKSHEYLFLLSKSERYYYDADAIKEPASGNAHDRGSGVHPKAKMPGINSRFYQDRDPGHPAARKVKQNASFSAAVTGTVEHRNKRTVWTVATSPYPGAHYATFPEALIEPCILAGSRSGDIVLDPFFGSGTTGRMAIKHRRRCIGIDLNPAYVEQAEARTDGVQIVMEVLA